jgi:hypothetical protein
VRSRPDDYRAAALERIGEALALHREQGRYVLSMYTAGLAAECMLRAYHRADQPFDERHDIVELFNACDLDRLGDSGRRRIRGPIQTIRQLWLNSFRFASTAMLRAYLHRVGLDRGLPREADALKVRSRELFNACSEVVTIGEERWIAS